MQNVKILPKFEAEKTKEQARYEMSNITQRIYKSSKKKKKNMNYR